MHNSNESAGKIRPIHIPDEDKEFQHIAWIIAAIYMSLAGLAAFVFFR